jgi:DNA-binding CsgD family transcriptional regulator/tetratricopeptide (TPR) repeat protein
VSDRPVTADLLERRAELDLLRRGVQAAAGGRGRLMVFNGPGGIGKSCLLRAARELAEEEGLSVLHARCSQLEHSFTFGATRQLLDPVLRAADDDRRARLFEGAASLAAPLFDPAEVVADSPDALFTRLHGLYWLIANLAEEAPLAVVVDDLHWSDEASILLLAFLARRLGDLPVLVVAGTRPADDPSTLVALEPVLDDPEAIVVRPAPLTDAAVSALLAERTDGRPDQAFLQACVETTGGNPFLVGQLVEAIGAEGLRPSAEAARHVRSIGPAGVAAAVLARLRRVSAAGIDMARAMAILGDDLDARTLGAFAGLDEREAVDAARVLEAACVAGADGRRLHFVHPIVRQAVYRDLGAVERGEGHARAAAFLSERGAPADAVAAHLLHAPGRGDPETVAVLRAAAARAEGHGDAATARELLERALAEPPPPQLRPQVLLELGLAAAHAGAPDARERLEACLATRPPADTLVRATEALAELHLFSGHSDLAVDALEAAIGAVGVTSDHARRLEAFLTQASSVTLSARRRLLPWVERLADPCPGRPAQTAHELRTLTALAYTALFDDSDAPRARDYAMRALAMPLDQPVDRGTWGALYALATSLMGVDEHDAADGLLSGMLDRVRQAGARALVASTVSLRALERVRQGRIALADTDAQLAIELLPVTSGTNMLANAAVAAAVWVGIEQEQPRAPLEAQITGPPFRPDPDLAPYSQVLLAHGDLLLAHDEPASALERFGACDIDAPGWGARSPSLVPWRSGASAALLSLGREDEALALAREELALAQAARLGRPLGVAQRAVALAGPAADRADGLRAAVATLEPASAPLELARTLVELGAELRRSGRRSAARESLLRAHAQAEELGAARTASRARRELRELGVRTQASAGTGLASLTPAERRVADLAAGGRTNREIAQVLFLSEKTVETHLGRVFRKLDASSRRQLPQLLRSSP